MNKLQHKQTFINILFILFLGFTCAAQSNGNLKIEASENIKQLITKKKSYNKDTKFVKGYKIQIYYGNETGAREAKAKFDKTYEDIESTLSLDSPDWKVRVGNFKKRLEADKALSDVKEVFPSAIVVSGLKVKK